MWMTRLLAASLAAVLLAGCGDAPFDYDKASKEEREAWLMSYGEGMKDGLRDGLRSADALKYFYVEDPVVNANERRIVVAARFKSSDIKLRGQNSQIREKLLGAMCSHYKGGILENLKVTVRVNILNVNGGKVISVEQTPGNCAKYG